DVADILYLTFYLVPDPDEAFLGKPSTIDSAKTVMVKNFLVIAHQVFTKQLNISPIPTIKAPREMQNEAFQQLAGLYATFAPDALPAVRTLITKLGGKLTVEKAEDSRTLLMKADSVYSLQKRDFIYMRAAMLTAHEGDFDGALAITKGID